MKKYLLIFSLFIGLQHISNAQSIRNNTCNSNAWFIYNGDHKINKNFGVHLEAQFRRANVLAPQQLLLRTGINYHPANNLMFTVGYCFVETYPYGAFPVKVSFPENRLWEQMQVKTNLQKVEWVSRFRLEHRFSNLPIINTNTLDYEPGDAVYTNRFRLLNRFSLPIDKSNFYLSIYDEFFINFGDKVQTNIFDQNRLYGALGYKTPYGKIELGYLEQTVVKSDGIKIENNHTMNLGFYSNVDFFKSNK